MSIKIFGLFLCFLIFFSFASEVKAQVVINEMSTFTPSNDWVELYAYEDIDISGWILRDLANSVLETIPANTVIGPNSTSKFYVAEVGNRLNIDGDDIRLYKNDETTQVDRIAYGDKGGVCAPDDENQSIGRVDNGNTVERFVSHTKNASNEGVSLNSCPTPSPSPTEAPKIATSTPTPSPSPKPSVTAKQTKSPSPKPEETSEPEDSNPEDNNKDILGLREELMTTEPSPGGSEQSEEGGGSISKVAVIFMALGVGMIGVAGYPFLRKKYLEFKIYKDNGERL